MTATIIPFEQDHSHMVGAAQCLACKTQWSAVAPLGTVWLECPRCHAHKGLMRFPCEREGPRWTCKCGNALFAFTPDGVVCPNCGAWQKGF